MTSIDSAPTYESSMTQCAECGASHGRNAGPRIIICCSGDLMTVRQSVGELRRFCLAFGLPLSVSQETWLPSNTRLIQCSCLISAPADSTWPYIKLTNHLQTAMACRLGRHGGLFDVTNSSWSQNSNASYQTISSSSFGEFYGVLDGGGRWCSGGQMELGHSRVRGHWHAVSVPSPHFCQWVKLPAFCRLWAPLWNTQMCIMLPGLKFEGIQELANHV